MSRYEQKIKDGATRFLQDAEDVLAAVIAAPRGDTQAAAGSIHLGAAQQDVLPRPPPTPGSSCARQWRSHSPSAGC